MKDETDEEVYNILEDSKKSKKKKTISKSNNDYDEIQIGGGDD